MKFNESWLKEYVETGLDAEAIGARLTLAGLELDGVEPAAEVFSGVVVARIESLEPHPDAEKLRVCRVNDGERTDLQVICGAANVYEGMVTALATVGAELPGGMKIKKAKLRGVESFGMLCSASELGMAESSDGIMELSNDAPVGTSIRDYLDLDDQILEIDLTPNRADCFSLRGVAREMSVLTGADVTGFDVAAVQPVIDDRFPVTLSAGEACPRYVGRVVKGVDLSAATPVWMSERLRRAGIRSLHPVVDVTNYVMLELGQPMHAFDLDKLVGGIDVRMASDKEKVTLLDGKELELSAGSLVIADANGAHALAGVMGGEDAAVSDSTQDIFLESAFFSPLAIAGRARAYGLHTESSHRFERGVDFDLQKTAIERATALIIEIAGGQAGPVSEVVSEADLPSLPTIQLRQDQIERRLGVSFDNETVQEILQGLGCEVSTSDSGWAVVPPSYRFDLRIEVDLIEELARVYGYDRIPSTARSWAPVIEKAEESALSLNVVKQSLVDNGYQEVITYSFVDPASEKLLNPGHKGLKLANPISADLSVMRSSLWPGLLKVASHNQRRQQLRIRIFETGLVFQQTSEGLQQPTHIAGALSGPLDVENWLAPARNADFFDMKADLEQLFEKAGIKEDVEWEAGTNPALHPGQCARLSYQGRDIGWCGALHPNLKDSLDLESDVYLYEVDLESLKTRPVPAFSELSRFPSLRRDLALLVDENVSYGKIRAAVDSLDLAIIKETHIFDVYQGEGVATGLKSIALGLILQDFSRTLEDADVEQIIERVLAKLADEVGASLRV